MAVQNAPVSLNLGSQRVGIASFGSTKDGQLLLKQYAMSEMLGDPAADSSRLPQLRMAVNELVGGLRLQKSRARVAISGQSTFTRFVKLPPLGGENIDQLVEFEAQQNIPFPINEVKWDYQTIGTPGELDEPEVALVAIKSDALNEINDAVGESGIVTASVDVAPLALYNAFIYNYGYPEVPTMLVDIGARTTNMIFMEGEKVFVRSANQGGSNVTAAIAKDFDVPFAQAEEMKRDRCYIALNGYADDDDPEVAAVNKVIRTAMTRLQGEVTRTINFYKSQQGGNQPQQVYLCGGGSSLRCMVEFLQEKLTDVPIEYFNPLQNVSIGADVDTAAAGADAHTMGELIGLGLRGVVQCPMEMDLVPDAVGRARDITKRKPFLLAGAACFIGALLVASGFFLWKAGKEDTQTEENNAKANPLSGVSSGINGFKSKVRRNEEKTEPIRSALINRAKWVWLLSHLKEMKGDDDLWFTQIIPKGGGKELTKSIQGASAVNKSARTNPDIEVIDEIEIRGMFMGDGPKKDKMVDDLIRRLKAVQEVDKIFNLDGLTDTQIAPSVYRANMERDKRYAGDFVLILPLNDSIPIK